MILLYMNKIYYLYINNRRREYGGTLVSILQLSQEIRSISPQLPTTLLGLNTIIPVYV